MSDVDANVIWSRLLDFDPSRLEVKAVGPFNFFGDGVSIRSGFDRARKSRGSKMSNSSVYLLISAAAIAIGIAGMPMWFGKTPPNVFYGFRVQRPQSSSKRWCLANRCWDETWSLDLSFSFSPQPAFIMLLTTGPLFLSTFSSLAHSYRQRRGWLFGKAEGSESACIGARD